MVDANTNVSANKTSIVEPLPAEEVPAESYLFLIAKDKKIFLDRALWDESKSLLSVPEDIAAADALAYIVDTEETAQLLIRTRTEEGFAVSLIEFIVTAIDPSLEGYISAVVDVVE